MKKKKNSKTNSNETVRLALLLILVIFIGITLGTIGYTITHISQIKYSNSGTVISKVDINTSVEVGKRTGMNGDRDALKFGPNTPGGGGTKWIDINSTEKAVVTLYISGSISQYLSVEKNNFMVESGEFVHLPVNLELPEDTPFGNYTGSITVILRRP